MEQFKIFDKYDLSEVKVEDGGLKKVINLEPKLILKSEGRNVVRYGQTKINVVERLMNKLAVGGHRGKKHKIQTSRASGKYSKNVKIFLGCLKIIENKSKENPIQVLIKAIENSAPRDEITTIEYGGARYPQAVDCSPLRRLNLAIRNLVHGAYDRSFGKKKKIYEALDEEREAWFRRYGQVAEENGYMGVKDRSANIIGPSRDSKKALREAA